MNPNAIKLGLALLWLAPGFAILAFDIYEQRIHWFSVGNLHLPLCAPFLILGVFNLVRWYAARSKARATPRTALDRRLQRTRRTRSASEYNPAFHFDDTPLEHGDDE